MNAIAVIAKRIVEQYGDDGDLSEESIHSAQFGVWGRETPGMLLIFAAYLAAVEHPELVERAARQPGREALTTMLKGELHKALALVDGGAEFALEHLVDWLWTYVRCSGAGPAVLDDLLDEAAQLWNEAVGEITRPCVRDGEVGPWDGSETPLPANTERSDFGVLKVPRLEGAEMHPLRSGDRIGGVIVSFSGHSLGLQVFRVSQGPVWEMVRQRIIEGILRQGGQAQESESRFGQEIRAVIPVKRDGRQVLQGTRIVGCDGPGWLLRGAYSGPRALEDAVDLRVHHLFTQTVIDLSTAPPDETEEATLLDVHWSTCP